MSFEIACPICSTVLVADPDRGMRSVRCGRCRALVSVPRRKPAAREAIAPVTTPVLNDIPPPGSGPAASEQNPFRSPEIGGLAASSNAVAVKRDGVVLVNATPRPVEVGSVLSATWHTTWEQFDSLLAAAIPSFLAQACLFFGTRAIENALGLWFSPAPPLEDVFPVEPSPITRVTNLCAGVLLALTFVWLWLGEIAYFQAFARLRPVSWKRIVFGRRPFFRGLLLFVLHWAIVKLVFLPMMFIEPIFLVLIAGLGCFAIYMPLLMAVSQTLQLLVDKDLGPVDSIRVSVKVMKQNKAALFTVVVCFILFATLVFGVLMVPMMFFSGRLEMLAFGASMLGFVVLWPVVATLLGVFYLQAIGKY